MSSRRLAAATICECGECNSQALESQSKRKCWGCKDRRRYERRITVISCIFCTNNFFYAINYCQPTNLLSLGLLEEAKVCLMCRRRGRTTGKIFCCRPRRSSRQHHQDECSSNSKHPTISGTTTT